MILQPCGILAQYYKVSCGPKFQSQLSFSSPNIKVTSQGVLNIVYLYHWGEIQLSNNCHHNIAVDKYLRCNIVYIFVTNKYLRQYIISVNINHIIWKSDNEFHGPKIYFFTSIPYLFMLILFIICINWCHKRAYVDCRNMAKHHTSVWWQFNCERSVW